MTKGRGILLVGGSCLLGIAVGLVLTKLSGPTLKIEGVLRYESPVVTSNMPVGYYVAVSTVAGSFNAVYIAHKNVAKSLDKRIRAVGRLSTICGGDFPECYPLLQARELAEETSNP